jgi:hypothetical protein
MNYAGLTPYLVKALQEIAAITGTFKTNLIAWLADASNGIGQFFADVGNFHKICVTDGGGTSCYTRSQLDAAVAAAGATTAGPGTAGAPAAPPASGDASTTSPTTSDTLKVNGNNPAQWPLNQMWNDNLGALFTHDGQSETIYSTSTVDTTISDTTTIDYWAVIPSTQQFLHATRDVVVTGAQAANDNAPAATSTPEATNDNSPLPSAEAI